MFRCNDSKVTIVLIWLSVGSLILSACSLPGQGIIDPRPGQVVGQAVGGEESAAMKPAETNGGARPSVPVDTRQESVAARTLPSAASLPPAAEKPKSPEMNAKPVRAADPPVAPIVSTDLPKKGEAAKKSTAVTPAPSTPKDERRVREEERLKKPATRTSLPAHPKDERRVREEETERDVMEEALVLLDEAQQYWVKGELEDALQMLDQAYALLLDTNGNPDIVRQKDDLRLMISKRILSIYNSHQSTAKGKRGEIPIVTNAEVDKEIRSFQTVERDFFISSYQRSMIYRPVMVRELKKAGLPEELSWLPLVESGYKINALSSARALGLWQFIPSTGYKYGLNRDEWIDERMDVEKSTRAAIDYFKDLHAMFGDWLTVLAGYNCGEGRVMRTIASQHINYLDRFWDLFSRLPNETARYVPRFLATLLIVRDPQKYGIDLGTGEPRTDLLAYEAVEINRSVRLQDVAQKLEISEETLFILNAELRHRMTPDRPYKLKVPVAKAEGLQRVIADIPSVDKPNATLLALRGVVIKHKVRQGETLASIAEKYKTTAEAIRSANRLSKQRLVAGQRLNVPIRGSKGSGSVGKEVKVGRVASHQVQKGETLSSISQKYRISVTDLRKNNELKNDMLKVGQTIMIAAEAEETGQTKGRSRTESSAKAEKSKPAAKSVRQKGPESASPKRYTVQSGDSLHQIARDNNISLDRLIKINGLEKKQVIRPGQVITVQEAR